MPSRNPTRRTILTRGLAGSGLLLAHPLLSGCATGLGSSPTLSSTPELVLLGGEIHTVNSSNDRVSAIAIGNGKVIATGSDKQISRLATRETRRISLAGRTVLPGINDSHLHLKGWGLAQPPFALDVTWPAVKSVADIVSKVKRAAANAAPGEWIVGRGWDTPYLAEGRAPTAADLDAVAPDNPVALTEFSGHALSANSAALKAAGITATTVPPVGGVIVKDGNGQPTGLLFEGAAWAVRSAVPEDSAERITAALVAAMRTQLERGITSATEPGLSAAELAIYANVQANATYPRLRMTTLIKAGTNRAQLDRAIADLRSLPSIDPRWLNYAGIKIMGDGIPTGNKTAWLHTPYVGGGNGSLLLDGSDDAAKVAEVRAMIDQAHRAGLQIGTHVTGDRSIDEVIAAYADSQQRTRRSDPRHYIIHADLVSPKTLRRMALLQVGANLNPEIKHLIADAQVQSLGAERAAYEFPFRSAIDSGVVVASSSDAPVTAGNWLQGLATCVDRRGKQSGKVSGPEQRISLDEAIHSYTLAGAWQDHADHYKGSLERGKVADLCVLDERLSTLDTARYSAVKVAMTMVDGNIVHNQLGQA